MIKIIGKIFILSVLVLISGCTFITKLEIHRLVPLDGYQALVQAESVSVVSYLETTSKEKLIFPLIYKIATLKNPYRVVIYIKGLKEIEILQAKIILNQGEEEKIFNLTRNDFEYSPLSDGTPYFYLKTRTFLDYPWEKIKEAEVIFEFNGIKDGVKTHYIAKKIFKPEFESLITNDALSI